MPSPFQYRLQLLFAVIGVCAVGCWFLMVVIVPAATLGSRRDLPPAEQKLIAALHDDGLLLCDQYR